MTLLRGEPHQFDGDWALNNSVSLDGLTEKQIGDGIVRLHTRMIQAEDEDKERVKVRASQLLREEREERAWENLLAALERLLKYTSDSEKIVGFVKNNLDFKAGTFIPK
jgi:hypothetical protein